MHACRYKAVYRCLPICMQIWIDRQVGVSFEPCPSRAPPQTAFKKKRERKKNYLATHSYPWGEAYEVLTTAYQSKRTPSPSPPSVHEGAESLRLLASAAPLRNEVENWNAATNEIWVLHSFPVSIHLHIYRYRYRQIYLTYIYIRMGRRISTLYIYTFVIYFRIFFPFWSK